MVVGVQVSPGERVTAGQVLGFLEAMKVEIAFSAPLAGVVTEIRAPKGQPVAAGDVLVVIEPETERAADEGAAGSRLTLGPDADPLGVDAAGGAGTGEDFRALLRAALGHYGVASLVHGDSLERALLRLFATQNVPELRRQLVGAVLRCLAALARTGARLADDTALADALARIAAMRARASG